VYEYIACTEPELYAGLFVLIVFLLGLVGASVVSAALRRW
jgi:hypothetical protein